MALEFRRELPSGITLESAYAWIGALSLDFRTGHGQVTLDVHPSADAWVKPPAEQIQIVLAETYPGGKAMPDLSAMTADPAVAAAFAVIATKIYQMIAVHHPLFGGAKEA